jgi:hypothetical protein
MRTKHTSINAHPDKKENAKEKKVYKGGHEDKDETVKKHRVKDIQKPSGKKA